MQKNILDEKENNSNSLNEKFLQRINRNLVHKKLDKNVLISDVKKIKNEKDTYISRCLIDETHDFFFEHKRNHLPGMYIIEAARQTALATGHKFYNIPLEWLFIINKINVDFVSVATLDKDIYIKSVVEKTQYRKNILSKAEGKSIFIQDGKKIASVSGTWKTINNKIAARYNYSQLA